MSHNQRNKKTKAKTKKSKDNNQICLKINKALQI